MKALLIACCYTLLFSVVSAQNYDESKVPSYALPELFLTGTQQKITNTQTWEQVRRPELLQLFSNNVYGQTPAAFDSVRFNLVRDNATAMNGRAHLKEVAIHVYRRDTFISIHLVLFIPNNARRPSPAFLLINNRGRSNMDPERITKTEFWPAEMLIDSGYAIAAFQVGDLAPDNKDRYRNGLLQLYPEQLTANNGMKAIGAWAFGASRVMDYFVTDPLIDARRVAVVGHSRGGKASLWTAAQDQRFALCITNCSGNTGAALARRQFGERISKINATFPYWFCNNYKQFNDNENALPVDQHMLIALVAPRPVYATNATKDLWADPTGTFLALKNAEKVYALYGKRSGLPAQPPAPGEAVWQSPLAYHNREGEHDMTIVDWTHFIRFANYQFRQSR